MFNFVPLSPGRKFFRLHNLSPLNYEVMANEPREGRFNFFRGEVPVAGIDSAVTSAGFGSSSDNGGRPLNPLAGTKLMGFAFFPIKTYSNGGTVFETTGIGFKLVTMSSSNLAPTAFNFVDTNVTVTFTITDYVDLSGYLSLGDPELSYNLLVNYNQSREFDLAYLDYQTYAMFKSQFNAGAIEFVRAAISMPIVSSPTASSYQNYRTLKFTPFPPPSSPQLTPGGVDDVAYRLGEPCPPIWYNDEGSSSSASSRMAPVQHAFAAMNSQNDPEDHECGCVTNMGNMRKAMVEAQIINDEFPKRTNVLRFLLIKTGIWLLVITSILILAGRFFENGKF